MPKIKINEGTKEEIEILNEVQKAEREQIMINKAIDLALARGIHGPNGPPLPEKSNFLHQSVQYKTDMIDKRTIRVIIHSPFEGFSKERSEMKRKCYDYIKSFCEERGLMLSWWDYRDSVNSEIESLKFGLNLRLNYIDSCQYAIVLLSSNRYKLNK